MRKVNKVELAVRLTGGNSDLHFISEVPVILSSYKLSDRIKKR